MIIDWRDRISIIGAVIISVIVVGGFIGVCTAVYFFEIPAASQRLADNLFGGLLVAFASVVNYWTGSTSGSQRKDSVIAAQSAAASAPMTDTPGMKATMTAQVTTPPTKKGKP